MAKSFSNNKIVACEIGTGGQLYGITADGNTRNFSSFGSPIVSIANGSTHAIVKCESGSTYLFDFEKQTSRHI